MSLRKGAWGSPGLRWHRSEVALHPCRPHSQANLFPDNEGSGQSHGIVPSGVARVLVAKERKEGGSQPLAGQAAARKQESHSFLSRSRTEMAHGRNRADAR